MKKQLCLGLCFTLCMSATFALSPQTEMQKKAFDPVSWKIRPAGQPITIVNDTSKVEIVQVVVVTGSGEASVQRSDQKEPDIIANLDSEQQRSALFIVQPQGALTIKADISLRSNTAGTYQVALVD